VQYEDGGEQVNLIATRNWTFGEHPIVEAVSAIKGTPAVCIYPLQYVNVTVSGCDCVALQDSGCQIPLISKRLFSWCYNETVGTVTLHGFGKNHTVEAPLVNMTVCLRDAERGDVCEIPIVCAVTDLRAAEYDVILPVVRELQASSVAVNVTSCDINAVCDVGTETNDTEVEYNAPEDVDSLPVSEVEADATALFTEQGEDPSLANCWMQAQAGKGGFLTHKGLLYHKDQVEGQAVCQLCVPQGRRAKILQLAHESVVGGHLGERKTRERISLSFYWPGLCKTVLSHVQSCCNCQLRSRPVTTDRVPLTQIPRADELGRFVTTTPAFVSVVVFSSKLESDKVDHLAPEQRRDLQRVLDDVADQFLDRPGQCDAVGHRTTPTTGFVPRQWRPYHVQPEVDSQSNELLDRGLVRPSDSPRASPSVCVARRDGGGRSAGDYRHLNLIYSLFVVVCYLYAYYVSVYYVL